MAAPGEIAEGVAIAAVVRRSVGVAGDGLASALRALRHSTGDGAPDVERRSETYLAYLDLVARVRGDLVLLAAARPGLRGAVWTLPTQLRAFWRLHDEVQDLSLAVLRLAIDGRGPVLDAATDAGTGILEAVDLLPWSVSRRERPELTARFNEAIKLSGDSISALAHVIRDDLGHGDISKTKGRRARQPPAEEQL